MYSKNIYKDLSQDKSNLITAFCEDYKAYISEGKTERLCVKLSREIAEKNGYRLLDDLIKEKLC